MAQSAKWRQDGGTQCSYMDVLSVRYGNAAGIWTQGATATDSGNGGQV